LALCLELRELSVSGNPCCAGAAATVGAAAGGVAPWWEALREALPQLHALDELDTGRRQVSH
jgi:hypothetical protein